MAGGLPEEQETTSSGWQREIGLAGGHLIVLELLKMADFGQIQRFLGLIDPPATPKYMNQGDPMH